ncbi:MAG: hypothetical protein N2322_00085 [Terrimicrobiaceae bacterium]|nr:hypothetical protein [Terrimicrobiaceae bacterium]
MVSGALAGHLRALGRHRFLGIFTPELGPPSSRYSITRPGPSGERIELADRWRDTLALAAYARGWARS